MPEPINTNDTEANRLRQFWNDRYREFSLRESGIKGLDETWIRLLYQAKFEAWRRALKSAGALHPGLRILDAGCGQGFFADAADQTIPDVRYTGIDISEKAVQFLRESRPRFSWRTADFCSADFDAGGPFDVIQSIEVMHLILDDANHLRALTHFAGALAPGGALVMTDTLPGQRYQANEYIVFRPLHLYKRIAAQLGLELVSVTPMYYFVPCRGWLSWPLAGICRRLPQSLLYKIDRALRAIRFPQFSVSHDAKMKMLVFRRPVEEIRHA